MTKWAAMLAAAALIQAPAAAGWSWPVDGPVLRPFVFGDDPYAGGQHRGIDIGAPRETPVHAASAGTVSFAGTVPSGGRTVTVQTEGGLSVTYLELGALRVARGAQVAEGDPIGTVGPAAHVHLGVRVTADPHGYLDPLRFLPARVETPAPADPVEVAPPAAAQPEPVVEPSAAQAAAPEPDGPPPGSTEPSVPPPAATEPAPARPAAVASDPAAHELAEPPAQAGSKAGARKTPVPMAEARATRDAPASAARAEPTARPRRPMTRPSRTPAPAPVRAKAKAKAEAKLSAEKPSAPAEASSAPAHANGVAEPVTPVSARPKVSAATTVGRAAPSETPASRGARGRPERRRAEPVSNRLALAVGLLAVAMVGAVVAVGAAVRRRERTVPQHGASLEAAEPPESVSCPVGRLRTRHVIHGCARAPGWVVPLGTPRLRAATLQRARPLPRPRTRVLAGVRS